MKALRAAPGRLPLFALLWWVLSEGSLEGGTFALLSVSFATLASLLLVPPGSFRWRPWGLLGFVPYFLWQSLLGGLDVARRALSPALPLEPGFTELPLRLRGEAAQAFLAWTVSLLPGTASAELLEGSLKVHVLDTRVPAVERLARLEAQVARLFASEGDVEGDSQGES